MLRQFLMGGLVSACTIVIHALVMTAVVRTSQATAVKIATRPNLLLIAVMVVTVSVLMAAHACEVFVWSLAYGLVDAAPSETKLLYFAFVNYTTLGYGDVVPLERW
jgi:Ion channel